MGIKFHFKWPRPASPCVSADVAERGVLSIFDISRLALPTLALDTIYFRRRRGNEGLKKSPRESRTVEE